MHIVSIFMFCMFNIIQPLEMQIQTNNNKRTWKEIVVENGQLAHTTWPLRSKVKTAQIRWLGWAWRAYRENQPFTKAENQPSNRLT